MTYLVPSFSRAEKSDAARSVSPRQLTLKLSAVDRLVQKMWLLP